MKFISHAISTAAAVALVSAPAVSLAQRAAQPLPELSSASLAAGTKGRLPAFFACLREQKAAVIIAHRGGPTLEFPENALETLEHTTGQAPVIAEIDVQESIDGVLFLQHDNVMERNTTGSGAVVDNGWASISKLRLKDPTGVPTPYGPRRFDEILRWADGKVVLFLDLKPSINLDKVIAEIKAAHAADRVIIFPKSVGEMKRLRAELPDTMQLQTFMSRKQFAEAAQAGVVDGKSIVFLLSDQLNTEFKSGFLALFPGPKEDMLTLKDVEDAGAFVWTLSFGGPKTSDGAYRLVGGRKVYSDWGGSGAQTFVTNRPVEAAIELASDSAYVGKMARCGVGR